MLNHFAQPQQKVEIVKALFKESGTYNDMTVRPFHTDFQSQNVDLLNIFNEATHGGSSISAGNLSGIANEFLRPTAVGQGTVNIDNGWAAPRLRFLIEVAYYDFDGSLTMRKIVQGYTNHIGIGHNGAVDPNMVLYFNNVITLRNSYIATEHGQSLRTAVGEASHLLRGDYKVDQAFGVSQPNMTWLMRPQDVFNSMGRSALAGNEDVLDLRLAFSDSPVKKSSRKNSSAPHYVSGVLKGFRDVHTFGADSEDLPDVMAEAAGTVKDQDLGKDRFFHDLTTQTTSFPEGGSVTYGEMQGVFPEFDHRAVVVLNSQVSRQQQPYEHHQVGQTEHWKGSNNETIWSTILAQSVPSVMMDLMITRIAFMATNQTLDGQVDVRIGDVGTFAEGVDMTPYIDYFVTRLKSEVIAGISQNNHIDFYLTMMADIMGETRITISIAGGPNIDFAAPSFCDALFAPVLTTSQQHIDTVAHDIQSLASGIGTQHLHSTGNNFNPAPQGGNHESII
tara:strand:- start:1910 stop:3424 length:1515 start_codon:yes stop_codon:yes gene_type:complete